MAVYLMWHYWLIGDDDLIEWVIGDDDLIEGVIEFVKMLRIQMTMWIQMQKWMQMMLAWHQRII